MKRQVGQRRRARARGPGSSGAAIQVSARGAAEESQRPEYPVAPHDPTLERDLVAALAAATHLGAKPDPADFYDVTLARIARAFVEHRARIGPIAGAWLERNGDPCATYLYTYAGLEEVLAELGDPRPRVNSFFAGILAGAAYATDGRHARRLADLARARRRLAELETERAELATIIEDTRPL